MSNGPTTKKSAESAEGQMKAAVQLYQSGRLAEAEAVCYDILSVDEKHPAALHLLGVAVGSKGDLEGAVRLVRRAVESAPHFLAGHRTLGQLHVSRKKLPEAIDSFRRVAELRPEDPGNWFSLGIVLRMNQCWDEAMAAFRRTLSMVVNHAEAHVEVGALLRRRKQFFEAYESLAKAVALRPDSDEFQTNYGTALSDIGRLDEAEAAYRRAIELSPQVPVYYLNLADLLVKREFHNAALQVYAVALKLGPSYARAHTGCGAALVGLNRVDEAIAEHRKALALAPDDPVAHVAMSIALTKNGDTAAAQQHGRRALELDPESASAWESLGWTLRTIGRFEEAEKCFRRSLEIFPNPSVYMLLSSTSAKAESSEVDRLVALSNQKDLSEEDRISAGFAVAKIFDDADRFDEAFEHYRMANSRVKQFWAVRGVAFDEAALHGRLTGTIDTFTPDFFRDRADWGEQSELPVFIVGMPRSGTSLVEQIAASHSRVFGAGELADMSLYADEFATACEGGEPILTNRKLVEDLAKTHLQKLISLGGAADRVIDKMPVNHQHLGLIATLFPRARVIFCKRDARDNCLSCYFQRFAKHTQIFSYDLADCGRQYREEERLYQHWQQALPLPTLTIQYEELVADLEGQSRRLIEFLGLEWEPRCLEFHKTERAVLTASVWQVRQPIYTRSVGRWKHYEKHLGPLLAALEDRPS